VGGAVVVIDLVEGEVDDEACVLFFDEFDSVARRRSDTPDQEWRRTVNQRLTSLEAHRDQDGPVVMAATNDIEQLDEAVIRPGRFGVWVDTDRDPPLSRAKRAPVPHGSGWRPCGGHERGRAGSGRRLSEVGPASAVAGGLASGGARLGGGGEAGVALRALLGGHPPHGEPAFGDGAVHLLLSHDLPRGSQFPL
jgi:hypothetical protein